MIKLINIISEIKIIPSVTSEIVSDLFVKLANNKKFVDANQVLIKNGYNVSEHYDLWKWFTILDINKLKKIYKELNDIK